MALPYLIDENLRGTLSIALVRAATRNGLYVDILQVGDHEALPRGTGDAEILRAAEQDGRILISLDRRTLAVHLANHLAAGRTSPGIILLRPRPLPMLADHLV
jgi:hypothetical protein